MDEDNEEYDDEPADNSAGEDENINEEADEDMPEEPESDESEEAEEEPASKKAKAEPKKEKARNEKHEKHESHHDAKQHKAGSGFKLSKTGMWQAAAAILGIFLLISIYHDSGSCGISGAVTADEAAEKTVDFINSYLLDGTVSAELKASSEENSMFRVDFDVDGQQYPSYVSPDGKLLFLQQGIDMEEFAAQASAAESETEAEAEPQDAVKAEVPEIELFVMSHCPYGTQMEKGVLPAVELLGDKVDFKIRFVYYAMHGKTEIDEQLNQHCIQKEFSSKYISYLSCFLKEGDGAACLSESGIDADELAECVKEVDEQFKVTEKFNDQSTWMNGRFPAFDVDLELNTEYGVRGSPHLVINGQTSNTARDPASVLKAICASFTNAPEECSTAQLSSQAPSAGFGYDGGASAEGSCG